MSLPTSNSDDEGDKETESFELLHEDIKRWVWNQPEWTSLRPIQEQAIPIILRKDTDVILSSPTAAGKTEAAFLPILSRIMEDREQSDTIGKGFDVLYISPLKALINDQFDRLDEICSNTDIPIHRRHGDVSSSKKNQALEDPDGVLLITPESVEALFIHDPLRFREALENLSYVVIDEIHSFIGEPRGKQLQSLLHRIEETRGKQIPRIALSATIADLDMCSEFLRPKSGEQVAIVNPNDSGQALKLLVKGYEKTASTPSDDADEASGTEVDIAEHIYSNLRGQDNLVFANRRAEVEVFTDLLKRLANERGVPNEFYAHHGSLSKDIREESERALKAEHAPATVVCTSTLELGIDIGWMDSIAQLGCPPSVSSMRQRLGRSGRKGDPAKFRIYIQEEEITDSTSVVDSLRPELVQTIGMVDLLLESWYEPPNLNALELSTLIQQLLSIIAERGGMDVNNVFRILCHEGAFSNVSTAQFESLLRVLVQEGLITQAGDGDLIMGLDGERLIRHYDFYAAFWTPDEFRLVAGEKTIGTLPVTSPLIEDQLIIFGGQRWEVKEVDEEKNVAYLRPAAGGRAPKFGGEGAFVHERVRKRMYSRYTGSNVPKYLDSSARDLLEEGRRQFSRFGLGSNHLLQVGEDTAFFLWTSDTIINTVLVLLTRAKMTVSKSGMMLQIQDIKPSEVDNQLEQIISSSSPQPAELAEIVENKILDKHDRFLSESLLSQNYASKVLDVDGATNELNQVVQDPRN